MQCLTWALAKPRGSQREPFPSPALWNTSWKQGSLLHGVSRGAEGCPGVFWGAEGCPGALRGALGCPEGYSGVLRGALGCPEVLRGILGC